MITSNWRAGLFIGTFFFMNQFQCEFTIIASYPPSHCRHAYQTTFQSCLCGYREPKCLSKIVPYRILVMPTGTVCPRPGKICSTILLFSRCQAGVLVTQNNCRFVGCSTCDLFLNWPFVWQRCSCGVVGPLLYNIYALKLCTLPWIWILVLRRLSDFWLIPVGVCYAQAMPLL